MCRYSVTSVTAHALFSHSPVYVARYGTHISESPDEQQLQDKVTDVEKQLQARVTELELEVREMKAALQALKPPQ